jgi:hypothetical protein
MIREGAALKGQELILTENWFEDLKARQRGLR